MLVETVFLSFMYMSSESSCETAQMDRPVRAFAVLAFMGLIMTKPDLGYMRTTMVHTSLLICTFLLVPSLFPLQKVSIAILATSKIYLFHT